MKFALVSLVVGEAYSKAVSLATKSKREYCKLHGYDFILEDGTNMPHTDRPIPWLKIPLIRGVLPNYDYVFWSDGDAMVVNYRTRFEDMFRDFLYSDKHMVITRDAAGNMNMGNFLLRNCSWSVSLLDKIWEQEQFIDHPWWENAAFIHLMETRALIEDRSIADRVAVVSNRDYPFNSYPHLNDYKEGDFIVHFAGVASDPHQGLSKLESLIVAHYKRYHGYDPTSLLKKIEFNANKLANYYFLELPKRNIRRLRRILHRILHSSKLG